MASSHATVLLLAAALAAPAAEPSLRHLFPVAGQQGKTVAVTASGKFDPWPVKAWVDAPGITFKPGDKAGKFDVEIASDAAPGPHLVRFFNDAGASAPRFFIVSREPELAEKEPNDAFKTPQIIASLPATLSGKLDKSGDVDSFAVTLKKDQPVIASVEGYVLASNFDGLLRIVDGRGTQFAFNHDGRALDPLLAWKAPHDGTFIVQFMGFVLPARAEVALTGGDGCNYRIHLSSEPVPRGEDSTQEGDIEEQESDTAQNLTPPTGITGRIGKSGDEDRFTFTAAKGHTYEVRLTAARDGSNLDAWLKIEDKGGKQLARSDDSAGSRDPRLVWAAPVDGVFTAVLGDVTHRGGSDFTYRLSIAEAVPTVTGSITSHAIKLEAGKTAETKVAVKRANGFKSKLVLVPRGELPEGVIAPEIAVPDKDGEVTLKFTATSEAPPASQPLTLVLRETDAGAEHTVLHVMTSTSEDNGVPQGFSELVIDSTDQLWLTVIAAPPKPETPKVEPAPADAEK